MPKRQLTTRSRTGERNPKLDGSQRGNKEMSSVGLTEVLYIAACYAVRENNTMADPKKGTKEEVTKEEVTKEEVTKEEMTNEEMHALIKAGDELVAAAFRKYASVSGLSVFHWTWHGEEQ